MENKRIYLIDYMKGWCMVAIVFVHTIFTYGYGIPDSIRRATLALGPSSHIFIVCSGFGLYFSHLRKSSSPKQFYKKRFTSMYLPYIIIILISALIPGIFLGVNKLDALFSHVFLYKMFIPMYDESLGGQFWFISTIIQFYLVFFILAKAYDKLGPKLLFVISLVISLAWGTFVFYIGKSDVRVWSSFFLQYLWEFVLGMIIADKIKNRKFKIMDKPHYISLGLVSVVCLSIYVAMGLSHSILNQYNDIFAVIGGISLLILLYKVSSKKGILFMSLVGEISYHWYLVHILVFEIIDALLKVFKLNIVYYIRLPIMFIISFIAALFYYMLCDRLFKNGKRSKHKHEEHTYNEMLYYN